ncbi:MAG TPA: N-acyl homoserine lactonase family protein [Acidisoma sp.]|jgi:glyoxylase-like metal-dependent hydrolase (beta-lactamase superfamily II)|nr:N-acyl homoserine lactonase family protein [Acidisoma sp.]
MANYSIWVLEYAYVQNYHLSGIVYGAHNEGYRKLPYCYVLIKGDGITAMVDVGYNDRDYGKQMADAFKVEQWHDPRTVLAECGVTPEEVTHVFITHGHFDHMGGTDHFPNARFYIQERELSKWVWAMTLDQKFRWLMIATDPGDVLRMVDLARQGRLVSIDGDKEDVVPGIDLRAAFDTHTWGSMYVTVRNSAGQDTEDRWILAGDLVYSFENIRGRDPGNPQYLPVGLAMGDQTNLVMATDAMVNEVGGDTHRVIPIHEADLPKAFPSRQTDRGLMITEITLAAGEASKVT